MSKKLEKPAVLDYQRPTRGGLLDNWPLILGTVLTFGILGIAALAMAFMTTTGSLFQRVLVTGGVFLVTVAVVIWKIEREW